MSLEHNKPALTGNEPRQQREIIETYSLQDRDLPILGRNFSDGLELIIVDRHDSHVHGSDLGQVLTDTIAQLDLKDHPEFTVQTITHEAVVGLSQGVETSPDDEIIFARRHGRKGLTRFVLNRKPEPTNQVTVVLKKIGPVYMCMSAWFGGQAEPEPWDRNATEESDIFWKNHALIFNPDDVVSGTETTECPW